jgi:hypothetical protein
MADLLEQLALLQGPRLTWIQGIVTVATGPNAVSFSYAGGTIVKAAVLDQYIPVVGDSIHALSFEGQGVLVLGSTNLPGGTLPSVLEQVPIIVNAISTATYGPLPGIWTPGVLQQARDQVACWFYSSTAWSALVGRSLQLVEIEVTRTSGGPPLFVQHLNSTAVGVLSVVSGAPWAPTSPPAGVPTWIKLPIGWGMNLVSGTTKGIGIVSNGQSGVYSGTGRVRLTPLSVTI